MKVIVAVVLALVAVAVAVPVVEEPVAILRSAYDQTPEGGYNYEFEAANGIQKQETGVVKEVVDEENKPHQVVVVRGSYKYVDPEGNPVFVSYEADQDGYRAESDSIPKPVSRR